MQTVTKLPAVVIDNGSSTIKAGFAGEDSPRSIFPSLVGKTKQQPNNVHVGYQAQENAKPLLLALKYPMERGIINDWDDMEKIWHYTFQELHVDPMDQPVFLSEPFIIPKKQREKMSEIMFETFKVPSMVVESQVFLSLVASGRSTGVVLDSGAGVTSVVPIYEYNICKQANSTLNFAGDHLTDYLMRLLMESHSFINSFSFKENYREIKKEYCTIALNFEEEMKKKTHARFYRLPDGNMIKIGNEAIRCTEPMFQPVMLGHDADGIHTMIFKAIEKCHVHMRSDMYANIILSGGNTMFDRIDERLFKELNQLAPSHYNINVQLFPERNYSAWIGGSKLAENFHHFNINMITKKNYEEVGSKIVNKN